MFHPSAAANALLLQSTPDKPLSRVVEEGVVGFVLGTIGATLALLMPGYILAAVFARGRPGSAALSDKAFISATGIGGVAIHSAFLPWTVPLATAVVKDGIEMHVGETVAWLLVVLYVSPLVIGTLLAFVVRIPWGWLQTLFDWVGLSERARTNTAWQWRVGTFGAWVRINTKPPDRRVIWGRLGTDSAVGEDAKDIYLQEAFTSDEDDWVGDAFPGSRGVWISGDRIETIEFIVPV